MTKQLERKARSGDLLSAFSLYSSYSDDNDEWFSRCWDYLQDGVLENNVFTQKNKFRLKTITFNDFRRFDFLDVRFEDDLTVIIGNNAQGKSSILIAIAKLLSWFVANILKDDNQGQRLSELYDIKNNSVQKYVDVNGKFNFGKGLRNVSIRLSRAAAGAAIRRDSQVKEAKEVSNVWRVINSIKTINLPVFVYYSVERSHLFTKPAKDGIERRGDRFDAYTNALSGSGRFDHFIEWFIYLHKRCEAIVTYSREDIEKQIKYLNGLIDLGVHNMIPVLQKAMLSLEKIDNNTLPDDIATFSRQKEILINTISSVIPGVSNVWVDTSSGTDVIKLRCNNYDITIEQLSDGQRIFLGLVADLTRRMIMLNPLLDNPLHGSGIVLIDEIELHLHPQWQQDILANLTNCFPNVQFVITTHSPIVLSTVDKRCIRQFCEDTETNKTLLEMPDYQTKGVINSDILEQVMNVSAVPNGVVESHWINDFEIALTHGAYERNNQAKELFSKIEAHFGSGSSEIKRCNSLIKLSVLKEKTKKIIEGKAN